MAGDGLASLLCHFASAAESAGAVRVGGMEPFRHRNAFKGATTDPHAHKRPRDPAEKSLGTWNTASTSTTRATSGVAHYRA